MLLTGWSVWWLRSPSVGRVQWSQGLDKQLLLAWSGPWALCLTSLVLQLSTCIVCNNQVCTHRLAVSLQDRKFSQPYQEISGIESGTLNYIRMNTDCNFWFCINVFLSMLYCLRLMPLILVIVNIWEKLDHLFLAPLPSKYMFSRQES